MSDILARSMRPRSFDQMIGCESLIKKIRRHVESGRVPRAWMFAGPTGSGKTTIARIIALSLQCTHGEFGSPCKQCYKDRHSFNILELNIPDINVKELREILDNAYLTPNPGSRRRVFILDEAHMMHKASQNLLLKYTEDCPRKTVFITCTTEPDKIIKTLRGRHTVYIVPELDIEGVRKLVKRGLQKINCDYSSSDLVEGLLQKNVNSPRLILNAVEKYAAGSTADEASEVEAVCNVDTKSLVRCVYTGNWEDAAKLLHNSQQEDVVEIRSSVSGYLREVLLGEAAFSSKAEMAAESILRLNDTRDNVAAIAAVLFKITKYFHKGRK